MGVEWFGSNTEKVYEMQLGVFLKQAFIKLKESNLHPAIKIGGGVAIALVVGYATIMGIPL